MAAHGTRQHHLLEISSLANKILDRIPVPHTDHILFNDRSFVQILRRIVRCRPDNFYATVISLPIGIGADEGGEEGVVDVDDRTANLREKRSTENLHIPSHHDEFDTLFS